MKKLLAPLSSLKLTVILIIAAMLLVYAGTWAQIDAGPWHWWSVRQQDVEAFKKTHPHLMYQDFRLLSRDHKSSEQFTCFNRRYHEMKAE